MNYKDLTTKDRKIGFDGLVSLLEKTHTDLQRQAVHSVDVILVIRNWLFGLYIVEYENGGAERAELYGKLLINRLSETLSAKGIKGASPTNLRKSREFYQVYSKIQQTPSVTSLNIDKPSKPDESPLSQLILPQTNEGILQKLARYFCLGWSHYVTLLALSNSDERRFYEIESINNSWGVRELKRQIDSSLYERLTLSRNKDEIRLLSEQGLIIEKATDIIKNPYVLEFLELPEKHIYSEHELETAIIEKLEHFLLELGKGFLFEARQKRFTFDENHFYVDLVFFNRLLKSYVLVDLKIGELKHQDLGQMQMYVNYFDRFVKLENENPTVGIILCKKKKNSLVEITLPKDSKFMHQNTNFTCPPKRN